MPSLRQYAAKRRTDHRLAYQVPDSHLRSKLEPARHDAHIDQKSVTGPAPTSSLALAPLGPTTGRSSIDTFNKPLGFVEDVAREYKRLKGEALHETPPNGDQSHPLDRTTLRRQRRSNNLARRRVERAIFETQYDKLRKHAAYISSVWTSMESGSVDEQGDEGGNSTDEGDSTRKLG